MLARSIRHRFVLFSQSIAQSHHLSPSSLFLSLALLRARPSSGLARDDGRERAQEDEAPVPRRRGADARRGGRIPRGPPRRQVVYLELGRALLWLVPPSPAPPRRDLPGQRPEARPGGPDSPRFSSPRLPSFPQRRQFCDHAGNEAREKTRAFAPLAFLGGGGSRSRARRLSPLDLFSVFFLSLSRLLYLKNRSSPSASSSWPRRSRSTSSTRRSTRRRPRSSSSAWPSSATCSRPRGTGRGRKTAAEEKGKGNTAARRRWGRARLSFSATSR